MDTGIRPVQAGAGPARNQHHGVRRYNHGHRPRPVPHNRTSQWKGRHAANPASRHHQHRFDMAAGRHSHRSCLLLSGKNLTPRSRKEILTDRSRHAPLHLLCSSSSPSPIRIPQHASLNSCPVHRNVRRVKVDSDMLLASVVQRGKGNVSASAVIRTIHWNPLLGLSVQASVMLR